MRFKVQLAKTIHVTAEIEVDADSFQEAAEIGNAEARTCSQIWDESASEFDASQTRVSLVRR